MAGKVSSSKGEADVRDCPRLLRVTPITAPNHMTIQPAMRLFCQPFKRPAPLPALHMPPQPFEIEHPHAPIFDADQAVLLQRVQRFVDALA